MCWNHASLLVQSSVTLVGEADRRMLKAAIKHGANADQIRHRILPAEAVAQWAERLENIRHEVSAVLNEEKEERQVIVLPLLLCNKSPHRIQATSSRNGAQERAKYARSSS
jgi:hypothetical protein